MILHVVRALADREAISKHEICAADAKAGTKSGQCLPSELSDVHTFSLKAIG